MTLIVGNWKMFKGRGQDSARARVRRPRRVVCPPYTRLADCVAAGLTTSAQNVHWAPEGAFTGEISAPMLLELGVAGFDRRPLRAAPVLRRDRRGRRSPRRAALAAGLGVIACVGKRYNEREADDTEDVLRRQVTALPQDDTPRHRVRTGLGDRHREDRDARAWRRRRTPSSSRFSTCRCSTAARSNPTTRRPPRAAGRRRRARRRRLA